MNAQPIQLPIQIHIRSSDEIIRLSCFHRLPPASTGFHRLAATPEALEASEFPAGAAPTVSALDLINCLFTALETNLIWPNPYTNHQFDTRELVESINHLQSNLIWSNLMQLSQSNPVSLINPVWYNPNRYNHSSQYNRNRSDSKDRSVPSKNERSKTKARSIIISTQTHRYTHSHTHSHTHTLPLSIPRTPPLLKMKSIITNRAAGPADKHKQTL